MNYKNISFIYKQPKKMRIVFGVYILLIIFLLFILCTVSDYSKLSTKAIVNEDMLVIPTTIENTKIITKSTFYKIDNVKYKIKTIEYSEIYNDGQQNLQDISLKSDVHSKNNQVLDVTFYYDKDVLIKKIMKGILK
jgi:hypothetical protein